MVDRPSSFDRKEYTVSGRKQPITVENLTPALPEFERLKMKEHIESRLCEIFSRYSPGGGHL